MADANSTHRQDAPVAIAPHAHELVIEIYPRGCDIWEGSRPQLEAEGLIPAGFEWPDGFESKSFERGEFDYFLFRAKPPGAKGRKSLWKDVDHWRLRRTPLATQYDGWMAASLFEKSSELAALLRKNTPEGIRTTNLWARAGGDKAFQEFVAKVIGRPLHGGPRWAPYSFDALSKSEPCK